jgi:hypothetical protein
VSLEECVSEWKRRRIHLDVLRHFLLLPAYIYRPILGEMCSELSFSCIHTFSCFFLEKTSLEQISDSPSCRKSHFSSATRAVFAEKTVFHSPTSTLTAAMCMHAGILPPLPPPDAPASMDMNMFIYEHMYRYNVCLSRNSARPCRHVYAGFLPLFCMLPMAAAYAPAPL